MHRLSNIQEKKKTAVSLSSVQSHVSKSSFQLKDNRAVANTRPEIVQGYFIDRRPQSIQQKKHADARADYTAQKNIVQKKENKTGLPDYLKSGIENISGYSMDDVKVHYNSAKPAQLNAHAYAQGTDIHIAGGQEKHLAHEAWHIVQQKQGRVKPTLQLKGKVNINDDKNLEKEADEMSMQAMQMNAKSSSPTMKNVFFPASIVQRVEQPINIIGLTHLVRAVNGSIFEGEEFREVTGANRIIIDTDQKLRSRRGPNQEIFGEQDSEGPQVYRWFRVISLDGNLVPGEVYIRNDAFQVADESVLGVRPAALMIGQRNRQLVNPDVRIGRDGRFAISVDPEQQTINVVVRLAIPNGLNFDAESVMVRNFWSNRFDFINRANGRRFRVSLRLSIIPLGANVRAGALSHFNVLSDADQNPNVNRETQTYTHNPVRFDQQAESTDQIQQLLQIAFTNNDVDGIRNYFERLGLQFPIPGLVRIRFSKRVDDEQRQVFITRLRDSNLFANPIADGNSDGARVAFVNAQDILSRQRTVLHEFGHMIGLGEEYNAPQENMQQGGPIEAAFGRGYAAAAATPNIMRSTIMGVGEDLLPHHYIGILEAFCQLTGSRLEDWRVDDVQ